ncbi:hypothetical protein HFN63_34345 [Rhizobium leguminosarum]|uniref:hypothetical protein n=1 Tax=Rhizobium leguminosarum TaxID=384 RepID=UPI001C93AE53|nr:hypothetical protein [Rhizobium leguminosarum]MBY5775073.1 hypothetical protein [Rhizobium leguminosarum]
MKTPQRSFVVEFKSGRRQPKAQTNSIWGDTDFKALSREVEDIAPHLFDSIAGSVTPDSAEARPTDPLNAQSDSERADAVEGAPAAVATAEGVEIGTSTHNEAHHPPEASGQGQQSQSASQPRTTSTDTPRKRAKRTASQTIANNSKLGHEDRKVQARTVDNRITVDELAALDADNKRLKGLLAHQLRAQNSWLKKMLARFDAA